MKIYSIDIYISLISLSIHVFASTLEFDGVKYRISRVSLIYE